MPSITSWLRLEPRSRENDVSIGLQARIHDPFWMLGRQWQLGEFKGEDTGSPIAARLEADSIPLTRCFAGPLPATGSAVGQPFDPATTPLETMVEREPYARSFGVDLRFSVDAGRQFLRALEAQAAPKYGPLYTKEFAIRALSAAGAAALDPESARFAAAFVGRVIDGERLYRVMRAALRPAPGTTPALPPAPPVKAEDQERVIAAARSWLEWYESIVSEPLAEQGSWQNNRMEYAFAASAASPQGEVVLEAPDYSEGILDWHSFSIRVRGSLGSTTAETRQEAIALTIIPAPVTYPGAPAERWWELEDSQVDFGAIQTLPGDLSGMVMLQFVLTYGNDWFVIPIDLAIGSLLRVRTVTVTDCFGVATSVPPFSQTAAADSWRMFTLSAGAGDSGLFFLPPSLGPTVEGPVMEEVLLVRDEMANMAWAIEKRTPDITGKPVDRDYALEPQAAAAGAGANLTYRLATAVPDNWVPLVPVKAGPGGRIRLRRGILVSPDASVPPTPTGRILGVAGPLVIEDEEIPRSGARVTRRFQAARWIDGATHLWIGRDKQTGRGEASSSLRFDTAL
jgi:hypothetical protein